MKDAYSFDRDADAAGRSYQADVRRLRAHLRPLGPDVPGVAADTGAIGGDRSHEFQVIADTGEDAIVYCPDSSDYAANMSWLRRWPASAARPHSRWQEDADAGQEHLRRRRRAAGPPAAAHGEVLVLATDERNDGGDDVLKSTVWLLLVRGDHQLNEVKAGKVAGLKHGFRFATVAEIEDHFGCKPGYLGPIGTAQAGQGGGRPHGRGDERFRLRRQRRRLPLHRRQLGPRPAEPDVVADIRNVTEGEPSPDGKGVLAIQRGIEVGHVFFLGSKYSLAMNATYLDEGGKPQLMQMGCYGIGVTRILGAAIEQGHDERGIVWPDAMAPFTVVICPIGYDRSAEVKAAADKLHAELEAGRRRRHARRPRRASRRDVRRLGADRHPHRLVISDRGLKEGRARRVPGPARCPGDRAGGGRCRRPPEGRARAMSPRRRLLLAGLLAAGRDAAFAGRTPVRRRRAAGRCGTQRALGVRSPTAHAAQAGLRHHRGAAGLPALAGGDEHAAAAPQGRAHHASSSSRRSGTRASAPASSPRWCWG